MPEWSPLRIAPQSVEEQVYEYIRLRITRAEYKPGAKFVLDQLSEEIGVSTTPIRAALKRLDSDGFVTYLPNKGARVKPLDVDRFVEIQEIRILIEPYAARLGAVVIADAALERMRGYLAHLEDPSGSLDDRLAWEWSGYMACYQASGNRHLINLIRDQGRLVERYTRHAIHGKFEPEAVGDYKLFVAACESRDGDAAASAAAKGLRRHMRRLVTELKENT